MLTDLHMWVVSYNFRPVWAGPAERFVRYAPGLRRRGIETTFMTAMREGQARREHVDGVDVVRVGGTPAVDPHVAFNAKVMLRALAARPRPDVLLYIGLATAELPLLWSLRAAGTGTAHVSTMARDRRRPRVRQWLVDRGVSVIERCYDRIVTSNEELAAEHAALGVAPRRLAVIPNGVSLTRFRPAAGPDEVSALRLRLGLPVDEPLALFVGPIVKRKGLIDLVAAWRLHRAAGGPGRLLLVGQDLPDDDRGFTAEWGQLMAGLTPDDRIERRPPHTAIEDFYRAADVFVFLSRLEGLPNVLPESMACGLPVLTTRFQGFSPELGRDGAELVLTDGAPATVARQLGELLTDGARRRALGSQARAWVEAHHDLEHSLDRYADMCRAVAGELRTWHRGLLGRPGASCS